MQYSVYLRYNERSEGIKHNNQILVLSLPQAATNVSLVCRSLFFNIVDYHQR